MKQNTPIVKEIPLDIVGSSTFGRDTKIQASRTFNMIVADDWLVDYAGYEKTLSIPSDGFGRGIFSSLKSNRLIIVIYNKVYSVNVLNTLSGDFYEYTEVGTLNTFFGDVFLDENNANQIAICDKNFIYIYNYETNVFTQATLPDGFKPGYITFHDTYFIAPNLNGSNWALSDSNNGLSWFWGAGSQPVIGEFQTKPDIATVVIRFPGRQNMIFVMGKTLTELWTDVGRPVFPYVRNTSINFDFGCINAATVAASEEIVAWVGINENSGLVIMYSTGSDIKQISTDGINYKLSELKYPQNSYAFFVRIAGHLIYHLTFYDDNYSLIYDFTTGMFFDVTDENMNYHIALRVAFYNNSYFFISQKDSCIYRMSPELTSYNYLDRVLEIPRIRVCSNLRVPNSFRFAINNLTFTMQQGNDPNKLIESDVYNPRISLRLSKDGGYSFTNYITKPIYKLGKRQNRVNFWQLGQANEVVPEIRFWGLGAWKATNGIIGIYQ